MTQHLDAPALCLRRARQFRENARAVSLRQAEAFKALVTARADKDERRSRCLEALVEADKNLSTMLGHAAEDLEKAARQ